MSQTQRGRLDAYSPHGWSFQAIEVESSNAATSGLASSPLAVIGFFVGWAALGLVVARYLTLRGHDTRTMRSLGAGLGPLMFVVALDAIRHRERTARPFVFDAGVARGGGLDVLVLLPGRAEQIVEVLPSLDAVQGDLRSLTLARTVPYEWLEDDSYHHERSEAEMALRHAARLISVPWPALMLLPGTPAEASSRFTRGRRCGFVLVAVDGESSGLDLPSGR